MSSSEDPERRPIISARQARQGVTGHNVRLVLGFSLAAIVVVFAIIWMVLFRLKTCNQPQGGLAQSRQGAVATT